MLDFVSKDIDANEAAEKLGVSVSTFYRWMQEVRND